MSISTEQHIPCPVCNTSIPFDVQAMLRGLKFSCPKCEATIGLGDENQEAVEKTMEKFKSLKDQTLKNKNND